MKKIPLILIIILAVTVFLFPVKQKEPTDRLTIDYEMVEKGIQWLEFINTGAGDDAIKDYFMSQVAPTKGSQSIIHHWARFREWNNEIFYKLIMTALGRIPTDKKLKNDDGTLTSLGRSKKLWTMALKNTEKQKKDLADLKSLNFKKQSLQRAKTYLPPETVFEADFYFVLFGYSSAFSVGKENGYDFLQLPRQPNGKIDLGKLSDTFAHEMHHTGFDYLMKKNLQNVKNQNSLLLLGILAAEGMPTYFIDQPWKHLKEYKSREDSLAFAVAIDWEKHSHRLADLYKEAEKDIRSNLEGKLEQKELMGRWMSGYKGAAYILGADMIGIIDKYLGRKAAINIASDYRQLLVIYNRAASKALEKGKKVFFFNKELAKNVSTSQ